MVPKCKWYGLGCLRPSGPSWRPCSFKTERSWTNDAKGASDGFSGGAMRWKSKSRLFTRSTTRQKHAWNRRRYSGWTRLPGEPKRVIWTISARLGGCLRRLRRRRQRPQKRPRKDPPAAATHHRVEKRRPLPTIAIVVHHLAALDPAARDGIDAMSNIHAQGLGNRLARQTCPHGASQARNEK